MISISRATARTLRSVFRKAGDVRSRAKPAFVCFRADDSGLRIQAQAGGLRIQAQAGAIGVEHRVAGSYPAESFVLPFAALSDFEGAANKPVSFAVEENGVRAEWSDGNIPQRRVYSLVRSSALWFDPPELMREVGDGSVIADIHEAMEVCAMDQVRFALSCVQLRGSKGQAVGSDGRQLLVVRGLSLPWPDDVLVPGTRLFASKIFTEAQAVEMVRTDDRVVFRAGPWTTVRDFCFEHELSEANFYAWRREIARRDCEAPGSSAATAPSSAAATSPVFVNVRVADASLADLGIPKATSSAAHNAAGTAIEVILSRSGTRGRRRLLIRPGFDADSLRRLLPLLESEEPKAANISRESGDREGTAGSERPSC